MLKDWIGRPGLFYNKTYRQFKKRKYSNKLTLKNAFEAAQNDLFSLFDRNLASNSIQTFGYYVLLHNKVCKDEEITNTIISAGLAQKVPVAVGGKVAYSLEIEWLMEKHYLEDISKTEQVLVQVMETNYATMAELGISLSLIRKSKSSAPHRACLLCWNLGESNFPRILKFCFVHSN